MNQHDQGTRQQGGDLGNDETSTRQRPRGRFSQSGGGADGNTSERRQQHQQDQGSGEFNGHDGAEGDSLAGGQRSDRDARPEDDGAKPK